MVGGKVRVTVFLTPECPGDRVRSELEAALKEAGVDYELEEIYLANDEEAKQHRVLGVPTIRINGVDVDPNFEDRGVYSSMCSRVYKWEGKLFDYPPKDMIKRALERLDKG